MNEDAIYSLLYGIAQQLRCSLTSVREKAEAHAITHPIDLFSILRDAHRAAMLGLPMPWDIAIIYDAKYEVEQRA